MHQRHTQAHHAAEFFLIILWSPIDALTHPVFDHNRRIIDLRGQGKAMIQCRRIQKRLEPGARLTLRLGDMIEFAVMGKVEAADQRTNGACGRIERHKCPADCRNFRQQRLAIRQGLQANQITRREHLIYGFRSWAAAIDRFVFTRPTDRIHRQYLLGTTA